MEATRLLKAKFGHLFYTEVSSNDTTQFSPFRGGSDIYIYCEASGAVIMSDSIPVADMDYHGYFFLCFILRSDLDYHGYISLCFILRSDLDYHGYFFLCFILRSDLDYHGYFFLCFILRSDLDYHGYFFLCFILRSDLDYHGYFSLKSWVSDSMIDPKPLAAWDLL